MIEAASVRDGELTVVVRNEGPVASDVATMRVTTRAGGFMLGTGALPVAALAPEEAREIQLPLPVWARERPDLLAVVAERGCCRTRVRIGDAEVEVAHPLSMPVAAGPP